jgi:MFS family permease
MIAGAVQNGFFFWAWYAWQPYFLELVGQDAVWVAGIVAGALSMAMILGNSLVGVFTRVCGRRTTLLAWAGFALGVSAIGVGLADTFPIALAFLLVLAAAMGVTMPVRQAFIHGMVTSSQRATVVSLDSMISGVGAMGGQAGLGVLADREGYATGYVVGGAISLGAVPFIWLARRLRPDADAFHGSEGAHPKCPPAGLPAISNVESLSLERE